MSLYIRENTKDSLSCYVIKRFFLLKKGIMDFLILMFLRKQCLLNTFHKPKYTCTEADRPDMLRTLFIKQHSIPVVLQFGCILELTQKLLKTQSLG